MGYYIETPTSRETLSQGYHSAVQRTVSCEDARPHQFLFNNDTLFVTLTLVTL